MQIIFFRILLFLSIVYQNIFLNYIFMKQNSAGGTRDLKVLISFFLATLFFFTFVLLKAFNAILHMRSTEHLLPFLSE